MKPEVNGNQNAESENVNITQCSGYSRDEQSNPSPDQIVLTQTSDVDHCMTFNNVCYEIREFRKCCVNTKTILSNVRQESHTHI